MASRTHIYSAVYSSSSCNSFSHKQHFMMRLLLVRPPYKYKSKKDKFIKTPSYTFVRKLVLPLDQQGMEDI